MKKTNQITNQASEIRVISIPEISNPQIIAAADFFKIKPEEYKERDSVLLEQESYGAWLYIRLGTTIESLTKEIDALEKVEKSESATTAEKALATEQLKAKRNQLTTAKEIKANLLPVVETAITKKEIAVLCYGNNKSANLYFDSEKLESILKSCERLSKYGKNHLELTKEVATLIDSNTGKGKNTPATKTDFYANLKKEMQSIYNALLPDYNVSVKGWQVADICGILCKYHSSSTNAGKTKRKYDYAGAKKVLRALCSYLIPTINKMAELEIADFVEKEEK